VCVRGSGLPGPLAFGPARAREKGPPFLALESETWSLLLRAALLGSGRQESFWKESATLSETTGFLHVSRAKVGARDATGTNGDPPRHPPLQAKLACSWHWQAGCGKFLEAPRRAGRPGGTQPAPFRVRPRHACLPLPVSGNNTRFAAARCTLTWRARAAGPSPCGLGLHARGITHGSRSPEQLQVAGRATDDARTAHADLASWATEQARGTLLLLSVGPRVTAPGCRHRTEL